MINCAFNFSGYLLFHIYIYLCWVDIDTSSVCHHSIWGGQCGHDLWFCIYYGPAGSTNSTSYRTCGHATLQYPADVWTGVPGMSFTNMGLLFLDYLGGHHLQKWLCLSVYFRCPGYATVFWIFQQIWGNMSATTY